MRKFQPRMQLLRMAVVTTRPDTCSDARMALGAEQEEPRAAELAKTSPSRHTGQGWPGWPAGRHDYAWRCQEKSRYPLCGGGRKNQKRVKRRRSSRQGERPHAFTHQLIQWRTPRLPSASVQRPGPEGRSAAAGQPRGNIKPLSQTRPWQPGGASVVEKAVLAQLPNARFPAEVLLGAARHARCTREQYATGVCTGAGASIS
jgi:hypothetical protein